MSQRLLRRQQVQDRTGYAKSTIYALIQKGEFPPPIRLGPGAWAASGWIESEIDEWIDQRIAASRGSAA